MLLMKVIAFWDIAPCSPVEVERRLELLTASIFRVLMMEAVRSSKTSVFFEKGIIFIFAAVRT
jgi:hypothetical protein